MGGFVKSIVDQQDFPAIPEKIEVSILLAEDSVYNILDGADNLFVLPLNGFQFAFSIPMVKSHFVTGYQTSNDISWICVERSRNLRRNISHRC